MKRLLTGALALSLIAGTGLATTATADPYDRYHRGYHDWRSGDRVDRAEWRRWERVNWRRHHLHRPPPGYEWRQYNGQYFQVAIGDGRIGTIIRIR